MIKVTFADGSFFTAESLDALSDEQGAKLGKAYASGNFPKVEPIPDLPFPEPKNAEQEIVDRAIARGVSAGWADPGKGDVFDPEAAKRNTAVHDALRASGVEVNTRAQVAPTGTRMMAQGYASQAARAVEHASKMRLDEVAHEIETRVTSERRTDVAMSASELSAALTVNGKIHVAGKALTEQAIRGLASRLESPMLGYVLGVRDRIGARKDLAQSDREMIADVIRHECRANPDAKLVLRTRNGGVDDVYAIVSPSYQEADATTILPEILSVLPPETRATFAYDPKTTQWEIRASVFTPTPVDEQAIGEAFEGYASLRSRDNGTSKFRGDGGATILACYNAGTYNAGGAAVSRVHRGKVARDVRAMIAAATRSIHVLCQAWGMARQSPIPMTADEKAMGDAFLHSLWLDMLKTRPLEGVLVGRKADHASALVSAYHSERRNPAQLVRADLAQAWTKYIQTQPSDRRRDAEAAIGSWLVEGAK
jgi:hypothetical protein